MVDELAKLTDAEVGDEVPMVKLSACFEEGKVKLVVAFGGRLTWAPVLDALIKAGADYKQWMGMMGPLRAADPLTASRDGRGHDGRDGLDGPDVRGNAQALEGPEERRRRHAEMVSRLCEAASRAQETPTPSSPPEPPSASLPTSPRAQNVTHRSTWGPGQTRPQRPSSAPGVLAVFGRSALSLGRARMGSGLSNRWGEADQTAVLRLLSGASL